MTPQQAAAAVLEAYAAWAESADILHGCPSLALSDALQDLERTPGPRTLRERQAQQAAALAWRHFCNYQNNDPLPQAYEGLEAAMQAFGAVWGATPARGAGKGR